MNDLEQLLQHHLRTFEQIDLATIDAAIANATGNVEQSLIDGVKQQRIHTLHLIRAGKKDAALEAMKALISKAELLNYVTKTQTLTVVGDKVKAGGKKGAKRSTGNKISRDSKEPEIVEAIAAYTGEPRYMAGIIAKKLHVTPQYVRQIKAKLTPP